MCLGCNSTVEVDAYKLEVLEMALLGVTVEEINKTMGTGDGVARGFFIVCCACGRAQAVKLWIWQLNLMQILCDKEEGGCGQSIRVSPPGIPLPAPSTPSPPST